MALCWCLPGGSAGRGYHAAKLPAGPPLRPDDLVFLDLDCGATCDAVARVTVEQFGVAGPAFSHLRACP
jgi:hypothetical protein